MNSLNFENPEHLKRFQKELNTIIEAKIANVELEQVINNVNNSPLGTLINIFESVSDKLYETTKGKKIIKRYIKTLKENKNLNNAYTLTKAILSPVDISNPELFIQESSNLIKKIGKEKLSIVIKDAIREGKLTKDELNTIINENKELNESIEFVFTKPINTKTIHEHVKHTAIICEYIKQNNSEIINEENDSNPKELINTLLEKLQNNNNEYWQNKVISDYTLCELSNGNKINLFETYKKDCESELNNLLENGNVEDKARFYTMKEQLSTKKYSEATLFEDLLNLAELKITLAE